jgi:hypothetical protein
MNMVKEVTRTVYQASNGREYVTRLAAEQEDLRARVTQFLSDRADPNSSFVEDGDFETAADAIIKYWPQLRQVMDEAELLMKEARGEASSQFRDAIGAKTVNKVVAALCEAGVTRLATDEGAQ